MPNVAVYTKALPSLFGTIRTNILPTEIDGDGKGTLRLYTSLYIMFNIVWTCVGVVSVDEIERMTLQRSLILIYHVV